MSDFTKAAAAAAQRKRKPRNVHVHTWICTEESCPGNGFITKAELVLMSLARNTRVA